MSSGNFTNIPGGNSWQNPVTTFLDLPSVGNFQGDIRVTLDTGVEYIWKGNVWVAASNSGSLTNVNLTEVGGASIDLGQETMANSFPVVIASDQSPVAVTGFVTETNASIGLVGFTAPTSATEVGAVDSSGNLEHLLVNAQGALQVTEVFGVQNVVVSYNEVSGLAIGVETQVNSFTAPASPTITYLLTILCSGGNRGTFSVYNGVPLLDKQYTPLTTLSALFDYKTNSSSVPGMVIAPGTTIKVTAINGGTDIASFNARFLILEVNP